MRYAIDIGGTKTAIGAFASQTELVEARVIPTPTASWAAFQAAIVAALAELGARHRPATRVGVSVAGVVHPRTGVVRGTHLPAIHAQPLAEQLEAALACPVSVANDADCFALAEARHGRGRGAEVMLGLILGTGVGGAVVVGGRLVAGRSGISGEWGHGNRLEALVASLGLRVRTCACGLGTCLDLYGAGQGLANIFADLGGEPSDAQAILLRWASGQAVASRAVDVWSELVATQIAMLVNVLDPQRVVVGGGLANDVELLARLDVAVRARCLSQVEAGEADGEALVVGARFINDGSLRGAASL